MRSLIAVALPWLVWGLLDTGVYTALKSAFAGSFDANGVPATTALISAFLVLRGIYSVVAGGLAARIARGRTVVVRVAIGVLFVTGVVAQVFNASFYPMWYHVIFVISIVPCAWVGARLARTDNHDALFERVAG